MWFVTFLANGKKIGDNNFLVTFFFNFFSHWVSAVFFKTVEEGVDFFTFTLVRFRTNRIFLFFFLTFQSCDFGTEGEVHFFSSFFISFLSSFTSFLGSSSALSKWRWVCFCFFFRFCFKILMPFPFFPLGFGCIIQNGEGKKFFYYFLCFFFVSKY